MVCIIDVSVSSGPGCWVLGVDNLGADPEIIDFDKQWVDSFDWTGFGGSITGSVAEASGSMKEGRELELGETKAGVWIGRLTSSDGG